MPAIARQNVRLPFNLTAHQIASEIRDCKIADWKHSHQIPHQANETVVEAQKGAKTYRIAFSHFNHREARLTVQRGRDSVEIPLSHPAIKSAVGETNVALKSRKKELMGMVDELRANPRELINLATRGSLSKHSTNKTTSYRLHAQCEGADGATLSLNVLLQKELSTRHGRSVSHYSMDIAANCKQFPVAHTRDSGEILESLFDSVSAAHQRQERRK